MWTNSNIPQIGVGIILALHTLFAVGQGQSPAADKPLFIDTDTNAHLQVQLSNPTNFLDQAIGLYTGIGGRIDENHAKQLFQNAAALCDPLANIWIAILKRDGLCAFPKDASSASDVDHSTFQIVLQMASNGNSQAKFLIGKCYCEGLSIKKNNTEALRWFRNAAECGNADAQFALSLMYVGGIGTKQDDDQAVYWCRKSADQGHAQAQWTLGVMYDSGHCLKQDEEEAFKWYRQAAERGYALGQYALGLSYYGGNGLVNKDYGEAAQWFRKAADQGLGDSQFALASMYASGKGVTHDDAEAVKWFQKAADSGHKMAKEILAESNL